ncbi:hypothetical protein AZZ61_004017 [Klebsiella variicola]|nr:hypothetical protein AZZ61_004017 [Klebsiella variicola]
MGLLRDATVRIMESRINSRFPSIEVSITELIVMLSDMHYLNALLVKKSLHDILVRHVNPLSRVKNKHQNNMVYCCFCKFFVLLFSLLFATT